MDIAIALLPALFWGSMILFTVYIGGTAYSQILGITVGALLFASLNYFFSDPEITQKVFWVGLASGMLWTVGQIGQLQSIKKVGAATTMPISTGMQLVATTLFGALVLSEWHDAATTGLGLAALVLILLGVFLTSARPKGVAADAAGRDNMRAALVMLLVSTLGYLAYAVLAASFDVKGSDAIFPQSIGMVLMALLLTAKEKPYNRDAFKNILPGIVWALGSFFMFVSQPRVGVAISFSLAQVAVVISTLGSIFILKEKKTPDQMTKVIIGMVLMALLLTAKEKPYNRDAFKNILPGIIWALGSFFMFVSQPRVGVAISFSLAQVAVVISTLGSIFILKEKKTPDQMKKVIIGIALIVLAAVLLGIAKDY